MYELYTQVTSSYCDWQTNQTQMHKLNCASRMGIASKTSKTNAGQENAVQNSHILNILSIT